MRFTPLSASRQVIQLFSAASLLSLLTPINSPVAIPAKSSARFETRSDRSARGNAVIRLLDVVPTRRRIFHRSYVASRQYLAFPHGLLSRTQKKGDPMLETAGMWPKRALRPILARRLEKHASEHNHGLPGVNPWPKRTCASSRFDTMCGRMEPH